MKVCWAKKLPNEFYEMKLLSMINFLIVSHSFKKSPWQWMEAEERERVREATRRTSKVKIFLLNMEIFPLPSSLSTEKLVTFHLASHPLSRPRQILPHDSLSSSFVACRIVLAFFSWHFFFSSSLSHFSIAIVQTEQQTLVGVREKSQN